MYLKEPTKQEFQQFLLKYGLTTRAYADMSTEIGVPLSYSMVSLWASGRRRMKNIDHVNAFYAIKAELEQ
jgi:hypothetical protein